MMIHVTCPTAVALCVTSVLAAPIASAGDTDPKGPCFGYDIVGLGRFAENDVPLAIEIEGDKAYIAGYEHIYIMDISDNEAFTLEGASDPINLFDNDISLAINGDYLYFKYDDSFEIWSIEDPTEPWFVRAYSPAQDSDALVLTGNGIMAAGSTIIDIAFPYAPARNVVADGADQFLLHLEGNLVLSDDMDVWDLSDPFVPALVSDADFGALNANKIVAEGDFFYAHNNRDDDTFVFHRTGATEFDLLGHFDSYASDFQLNGSIMTAGFGGAIRLYDVASSSNLTDPVLLGEIESLGEYGSPHGFKYHDGKLFVTTEQGYLLSLKVHTNPVATHLTLDEALETKLIDNLALVADNAAGLQIFDITDPSRPVLRSTYPTPNIAMGVDAIPGIAFVAMHQAGLDIVDISDPDHPTLFSHFDTTRTVRDVKIVGNLAYLVDRIYGLFILDITDPANPVQLSTTDTPGYAEKVTVANGLAIVAHGISDTQIIDVADPEHPAIVSSIPPSTNSTGINQTAMQDDLLYVSDRSSGYRVFDLSNPGSPQLLISFDPELDENSSEARAFLPQGNLLYVANWRSGLTTLDNSDPLNPRIIANYPTSGSAANLARRDNFMFVSATEGGLQIYDLANCAAPCPADLNGDTVLDFFDISLFLTAFNNHDPLADLNHDGLYNFFDVSVIFNYFTGGCP